jgi:putative PIN family toxin of toxin-antitoxin system
MRMVLDTNVVVSGLFWNSAPKRLLRTGNLGSVELFTSTPLLVELRATLSKSKLGPKIDASGSSVDQLVDLYSKLAAVVEPAPLPRIAPDPDDDVVIGTALTAKANFLVTGDRALLSVAKYDDVRIVSVREALDAVAQAFPDEDHQ